MSLLIHQFEEYVLPGGAPVIVNIGTFSERDNYLRYPGNMHSSMLVNNWEDKNSPYSFTPQQMRKFDTLYPHMVEKANGR